MRFICSFLIAAVVAMFSTPASAQSLYDPSTGGLYGAQTQRQLDSGYSLQPWDNQPSWQDRQDQYRLEDEILGLEHENRRLRALSAQERDRQRRYDPASGISSPARSQ